MEDIYNFDELRTLATDLCAKNGLELDFIKDDILQSLANGTARAEIVPVSGVVGGVLVQEIIKILSQKDEPFKNFFFFSGK